jgi:hypothetical protein
VRQNVIIHGRTAPSFPIFTDIWGELWTGEISAKAGYEISRRREEEDQATMVSKSVDDILRHLTTLILLGSTSGFPTYRSLPIIDMGEYYLAGVLRMVFPAI